MGKSLSKAKSSSSPSSSKNKNKESTKNSSLNRGNSGNNNTGVVGVTKGSNEASKATVDVNNTKSTTTTNVVSDHPTAQPQPTTISITSSSSSSTINNNNNVHVQPPQPQSTSSSSATPVNNNTPRNTQTDQSSSVTTDDEDDEGPEEIIFSKTKQTVTKDDFELMHVIGKGSFGKVMQVRKKDDNKIFAMKVLRKEAIIARKQVTHTKSEKTILQAISHPFIVNLHYAFQTKDKLYMVLDYVNGGELFFHLKREGRFSEPRVKLYAAEIVSALAHLHKQDIVYRDLKPENILLDSEGHICITDFGLSKKIETTDGTFTFCGTPEYLAPEVLNGHGHGCAVDWWSLGTLLYEMLTGLPPFYSQNISMMYQKILNGELKIPSYISPEAKSFLESLLTRDVDRRLGSNGGGEVMNHPWFKSINWEMLDRKEIEVHFKPKVKSEGDISQIDPLFTQERPLDSMVETSALTDAMSKDNSFEGFTYVADSVLKA
ncbi:hypothetical protein SAMD00019534_061480 [Acytostelium subglobosum LB1]|uniref:hypothetical protein n=1 Tax=Acytostelium subglobosum LB1 TaxID=1410327 RepID=UPI000644A80F|nr:hypothetical protein SAMD00019534_061480 [Acytostelium subglobosum LB1]GAM22973.1 hypothetical protein SAMD00019534_061480 [Acytostelium subglobosum LB1]|eukprot:XP_012754200.1 hypothetical protein SAMD00019534_061480 [Acytostelium subglobosum LB1]